MIQFTGFTTLQSALLQSISIKYVTAARRNFESIRAKLTEHASVFWDTYFAGIAAPRARG